MEVPGFLLDVPRLSDRLWDTILILYALKQPSKPDYLEVVKGILLAHLTREMGCAVKIPVLYSISSDKKQTCSGGTYAMEYVKIVW